MTSPSPSPSPTPSPSDPNWLHIQIPRRRFLQSAGLATAALFLLPRSLTFAAKAKETPKFAPPRDYALNPIRPVLGTWTRPGGAMPADGAVTLDYDLAAWIKPKGGIETQLSKMKLGSLRIARKPAGSTIRYELRREIDDIPCEATVLCRAGEIETVESWTARWSKVVQTGEVRDGHALVRDGNAKSPRKIPLAETGALVFDGSLLCKPATLPAIAAAGKKFTRLDQAIILRPGQRIRKSDTIAAPWDASAALRTWLLTGTATVPSHFVCDADNRPLFLTGFLLSSALRNIS